ncbi:FKBP-type peptidyl-prolyl cis-trans isomerase [Falsiporphyromonas endometrii]|uniref:Peptidyl-prolyl cis-trans isomerase n=1 Tax=Falsiporphyromonas endometrii TaxID=1387297 RepID=A0ABV9K7P3_9PORP
MSSFLRKRLRRAIAPTIVLALMGLSIVSCKKSTDSLLKWRAENDEAFESYAKKPGFKKVGVDGVTSYIYMNWLKNGDGKVHPISTSRVYVHYETYQLVNGTKLDGNFGQLKPALFEMNRGSKSVVEGFAMALQNMVVGDETEFVVPWILAYGDQRNGSIQPYSALRFKVTLDSIVPENIL